MNRYYTPIPLAEWLCSRSHTCIGTSNSNRKRLPKEINETQGREEKSWVSCKNGEGEVTLNFCVVNTKSSGLRNVSALRTTNSARFVTQGNKKASYLEDI